MDNRYIGVFDSGLGGLTAVRRMHETMPGESIIYFGDTGRVPYGTRGRDTIIKYTRQDIRFLLGYEPKAIVVACNTASAAALDTVRDEFDVPIFGPVGPSCEKARRVTKNGRIGVIGTAATVRSGVFERSLKKADGALDVTTLACPLFVPLVENGRVQRGDVVIETVVREYLQPLRDAGVDTLILGCTHYPLLSGVIADFMGEGVSLVDSGAEAANAVRRAVAPAESGAGETRYFVSDDPAGFTQLASLFLQQDAAGSAELVDITQY
ncbi:MAG: glutamate racemase [Eubacteriales bacterium]|nr:glutamate racemase [Eubacteriales bacterium]